MAINMKTSPTSTTLSRFTKKLYKYTFQIISLAKAFKICDNNLTSLSIYLHQIWYIPLVSNFKLCMHVVNRKHSLWQQRSVIENQKETT